VRQIKRKIVTLKHIFDQHGTLCNVFFDDELFIIGSDEKDHVEIGWWK
jgi:hypothetical protein